MIDITRGVMSAKVYPGDPEPMLRAENLDGYRLSTLSFCVHTGTHVDAPLHFLSDGISVDRLNAESLSGLCLLTAGKPSVSELAVAERNRIRILLLKGCFVTEDLLPELQRLGIKVVGTDLLSVASSEEERSIHEGLFKRGILPLECLDLDRVSAGIYRLFALPMLIEGAEAAPVRAFLSEL